MEGEEDQVEPEASQREKSGERIECYIGFVADVAAAEVDDGEEIEEGEDVDKAVEKVRNNGVSFLLRSVLSQSSFILY